VLDALVDVLVAFGGDGDGDGDDAGAARGDLLSNTRCLGGISHQNQHVAAKVLEAVKTMGLVGESKALFGFAESRRRSSYQ
jgi:hypothetical protein